VHVKPVLSLLTIVGLVAVICATGFGYWLLTSSDHHLALVKLDTPGFAGTPCLGHGASLNSGLRVDFSSEWMTEEGLLSVLNQLTQQKWYPITRLTTSITLLPVQRTVIDLGLFQVPVLQAISLSSTPDHSTRLIESTSLMLCSPVL
jgi:hypothetical protein